MKYIKYLLPISLAISFVNFLLTLFSFNSNRCTLNQGIAFGIQIQYIYFITISLLVLLFFLGYKVGKPLNNIFYSLVILGSSNLLIRVLLNGICDYINIFTLSFNIVDATIVFLSTVGAWYIIFHHK